MADAGMTLDDFVQLIAEHFDMDPARVRPASMAGADLGVDLTNEHLDQLRTVQDWYDAYRLGRETQ